MSCGSQSPGSGERNSCLFALDSGFVSDHVNSLGLSLFIVRIKRNIHVKEQGLTCIKQLITRPSRINKGKQPKGTGLDNSQVQPIAEVFTL